MGRAEFGADEIILASQRQGRATDVSMRMLQTGIFVVYGLGILKNVVLLPREQPSRELGWLDVGLMQGLHLNGLSKNRLIKIRASDLDWGR